MLVFSLGCKVNTNWRRKFITSLMSAALLFSLPVYSEDEPAETEGDAQNLASAPIYLPIKPAFIVNYGGEGRLRYIKAEITVRLSTSEAASAVRHHLPYIRNNLVRLFASQTDESLESQEGKEALRSEAMHEIQNILEQEESINGVDDVLFTSLIIQK